MPRKRLRAKGRSFNPHPCELAWLTGKPYPTDWDSEAFLFFDAPGLTDLDAEMKRGFTPDDAKRISPGPGFPLQNVHGILRRLNSLYYTAPSDIRRAVPKDRAELLKAVEG